MATRLSNSVLQLAVLVLALAAAPDTHATLIMAARISGVGGNFDACVADQDAGCDWGALLSDADPSDNVLALPNGGFGGVEIGGLQASDVFSDFTPNNLFDTLTGQFTTIRNTNTTPVTITIAISDTGFVGPAFRAFTSASATFSNAIGATAGFSWCDDPANNQGATNPVNCPGDLIDTFLVGPVATAAQAFSHNGTFPVTDPGLFGMTLLFSLTLPGDGTGGVNPPMLTNAVQVERKEQLVASVPEPATPLLVGSVLAWLAWRARKR